MRIVCTHPSTCIELKAPSTRGPGLVGPSVGTHSGRGAEEDAALAWLLRDDATAAAMAACSAARATCRLVALPALHDQPVNHPPLLPRAGPLPPLRYMPPARVSNFLYTRSSGT